MILVLIAEAAHYKLFKYTFHPLKLELIKEEENVGFRKQRGKFINIHENPNQTHHTSYASPHHFREVTIDKFAQHITEELRKETLNYKDCQIIIIAGPHMGGLLMKHFDNHLTKKLIKNFQKDLLHLSENELLDYLQEHKFD